jgi:hypothetical protein
LTLGNHSQRLVQILPWTEGDALLRRHVANLSVIGLLPSAGTRVAISRSVSIPINLSPSTMV